MLASTANAPFGLFLLAQTAGGWFDGFEPNDRFALTIIALACVTAVAIICVIGVFHLVETLRKSNAEMDLKRDMIDRGMTAEEIKQVIEAAPMPEDGFGRMMAAWGSKQEKK